MWMMLLLPGPKGQGINSPLMLVPIIRRHGVSSIADILLANRRDEMQRAHFLVVSYKKSGAWLNVSPISSLGLDDATARISMGLCLGIPLC